MRALVFGLLWVVGLSAIQPPSKIDVATLILFREKEFYMRRSQPYEFTINDKERVRLSANRYAQLRVVPGRVKIYFGTDYLSAEKSKTLWLTTRPGQTYYVKIAIDVDFMRSTLLMAPIAEAEARQELRRMKPEKMFSSDQPN